MITVFSRTFLGLLHSDDSNRRLLRVVTYLQSIIMTSIELSTLPPVVRDSIQHILPTNSKPSSVHQMPVGPVSLELDSAVQVEQTQNQNDSQKLLTNGQRVRSWMQFLVTCCCMFAIGFNDTSAGPLLPRMQSAYQISFVVVSLVFIFSCVGFIIGACLNVTLSERVTFKWEGQS
jgi:phosphate/sulfate permease